MVHNKTHLLVATIAIFAIALIIGAYTYSDSHKPVQTTVAAKSAFPVLLVHGLGEDSTVWKKWEDLLKNDGVQYYSITFQKSDDKCGAAIAHATELGEKIQAIKHESGSDRVNVVGHSKGGIDTRVYLANGTKDVANLIMIGTPNAGTPLAGLTSVCAPGTWDVMPGANSTLAKMNPNTKYYTIAGDWQHDLQGNPAIPGPDDGQVAVSSVESEGYFVKLGRTPHQHMQLMGQDEYNLARDVILGKK